MLGEEAQDKLRAAFVRAHNPEHGYVVRAEGDRDALAAVVEPVVAALLSQVRADGEREGREKATAEIAELRRTIRSINACRYTDEDGS